MTGRGCLFRRFHHQQIASILQSLNSELLDQHHCLFGGGTAIVLQHDEFRESIDVDFLISDITGYRALRHQLTEKGISAITRLGMPVVSVRDILADQYGIRTMLRVDDTEIKLEIVFEARISLDPPITKEKICGVSTLRPLDMAATKLLANSDRWSDPSVHSRDIIDLAMLDLPKNTLAMAKKKASQAYGESIERDLKKAVDHLATQRGKLEQCMNALQIDAIPKALLWKKIKALV